MKRKMFYVDSDSYDGYNLYVDEVKHDGIEFYRLFLEKENFGDLQYIYDMSVDEFANIDEVFETFRVNLENGNFFYVLKDEDAKFEGRFDVVEDTMIYK